MLHLVAFATALATTGGGVPLELTSTTWESVIAGGGGVLVKFYAPWCGHCKALEPEYAKLARSFTAADNVTIAQLDADQAEHKEIAKQYGITGFPTLKWFSAGLEEPLTYDGSRDAKGMLQFINSKTGLQRRVGGGNRVAGKHQWHWPTWLQHDVQMQRFWDEFDAPAPCDFDGPNHREGHCLLGQRLPAHILYTEILVALIHTVVCVICWRSALRKLWWCNALFAFTYGFLAPWCHMVLYDYRLHEPRLLIVDPLGLLFMILGSGQLAWTFVNGPYTGFFWFNAVAVPVHVLLGLYLQLKLSATVHYDLYTNMTCTVAVLLLLWTVCDEFDKRDSKVVRVTKPAKLEKTEHQD